PARAAAPRGPACRPRVELLPAPEAPIEHARRQAERGQHEGGPPHRLPPSRALSSAATTWSSSLRCPASLPLGKLRSCRFSSRSPASSPPLPTAPPPLVGTPPPARTAAAGPPPPPSGSDPLAVMIGLAVTAALSVALAQAITAGNGV